MTKKEYDDLLASDYWKGYSYSLIKERNFTCADCGQRYERNYLNVHHLMYRDAKPWSYDPSELIVLCKDCHARRHGYIPPEPVNIYDKTIQGDYTKDPKSDGLSNCKSHSDHIQELFHQQYGTHRIANNSNKSHRRILKFFGLLFVIALGLIVFSPSSDTKKEPVDESKELEQKFQEYLKQSSAPKHKHHRTEEDDIEFDDETDLQELVEYATPIPEEINILSDEPETPTDEIVEDREQSKSHTPNNRVDESDDDTELSSLEILERINHKNMVDRAKQEGVSTEGSTLDIMERINHKNMVKRAKQEGVSTEGSTLDIMERINHKNMVDRAKQEGVSTEGSTLDIMERINRKYMLERAKQEGLISE